MQTTLPFVVWRSSASARLPIATAAPIFRLKTEALERSSNAISWGPPPPALPTLFIGGWGVGIDTFQSSGSNTIVNNTVTGNGVGTGASLNDAGIRIFGSGNTVDRNVVSSNVGAGIQVTSGATALITKNSVFL